MIALNSLQKIPDFTCKSPEKRTEIYASPGTNQILEMAHEEYENQT